MNTKHTTPIDTLVQLERKSARDPHTFLNELFTSHLPNQAQYLMEALNNADIEAFVVGGWLRDVVLDRPRHDIDLSANAPWEHVERVALSHGWSVHHTGIAHGTLSVVIDGMCFEVTQYRSDGTYSDARHPDAVSPVQTIEDDLARRDFTINALAWNASRGLVDAYRGLRDCKRGIIRAVGSADMRMSEDALRILRALRFASEMGFSIDEETWHAMNTRKTLLEKLPMPRVRAEFERFLEGSHVQKALVAYADIVCALIPELQASRGFDQKTRYHCFDVYEHSAHCTGFMPAQTHLRWAALLHDSGKPSVCVEEQGVRHFHGHAEKSCIITRSVLSRFGYSKRVIDRVCYLVKHHDDMLGMPCEEITMTMVQHLLKTMKGNVELFYEWCALQRADAQAKAAGYQEGVALADALEAQCNAILKCGAPYSLKQLAITGDDVCTYTHCKACDIGAILTKALERVIDKRCENSHDALVNWLVAGSS